MKTTQELLGEVLALQNEIMKRLNQIEINERPNVTMPVIIETRDADKNRI